MDDDGQRDEGATIEELRAEIADLRATVEGRAAAHRIGFASFALLLNALGDEATSALRDRLASEKERAAGLDRPEVFKAAAIEELSKMQQAMAFKPRS